MKDKKYLSIVKHYEDCFDKYGDSHLGVDWPKEQDVLTRYLVMLDLVTFDHNPPQRPALLDFGCGLGHFYNFILTQPQKIEYSGLDISQKFVDACKHKFPANIFYCEDILNVHNTIPGFDYIVCNGVFTEKQELSQEEMMDYMCKMLIALFEKCNRGIAFNVMSKLVDWERDDLFHVPFEVITGFISKKLSRNFVIRHDYGLYEYTIYIYKKLPV